MQELDKKIKDILSEHEKLKRETLEKKIKKEEYIRKKKILSDKINTFLNRKIQQLEKQKEKLVFKLTELEEEYERRKINDGIYHKKHVEIQKILAEIDQELSALLGGKKDIDTLYVPEKPKLVLTRSHIILAAVACFAITVFYMTHVLDVEFQFKDRILGFLKEPFKEPEKEEMLAGARKLAAGIMGGKEAITGFGLIKPLPGTTISSSGDITVTFMKSNFNLKIISAKAFNAESGKECSGDILANGLKLADKSVEISSGDKSFILVFRGCPDMKSKDSDLSRIGVEVVFDSSFGGSSSKHTTKGEINFFSK